MVMFEQQQQREQNAQDHRIIHICSSKGVTKRWLSANKTSTTKYKWYTFLPKGLYEQFRRLANLYFAFHAAITLTPVTPVNPVTTIVPLVFVIGVAMVKEAIEDFRRGRADKEVNNRMVPVLDPQGGQFLNRRWKEVNVGDILRVKSDEFFPSDMLLLFSNNPSGTCYVETMNLDGETNLKLRKSLEETKSLTCEQLKDLDAVIECEQPNPSIYTFVGKLTWKQKVWSIGPSQILLRGSKLRNTGYIYGVALFVGSETKIMLNSTDPPSKRSSLEKQLDYIIIFQLCLLFGMSVVSGLMFAIWLSRDLPNQWYLRPGFSSGSNSIALALFNYRQPFTAGVLQFFTGLVLYGYFVPISLYVSLEIVKASQAFFISRDSNIYYGETDKPTYARTSNLNEELGQVSTILSDKTGTLTRNEMEFFKCSIAGVAYGTGITEVEKAMADKFGRKLDIPLSHQMTSTFTSAKEKGFNLEDSRLADLNWQSSQGSEVIRRFVEILALCNTVVIEEAPNADEIRYLAESPDEAALVIAAKKLGMILYRREESLVHIKYQKKDGTIMHLEYELLNTIEFNSIRKRMSVIVRDPEGNLLLFCKGADNVIFERLSSEGERYKSITCQHTNEFAEAGLRTLALAYRLLDEEAYATWQKHWSAVKEEIMVAELQEKRLDELADEIEQGLILVGATAIEDKLQEGVPRTINKIAEAGIKIWVLTGDKMETAINIGYACGLLQPDMKQHIIHLEQDNNIRAEAEREHKTYDEFCRKHISSQIEDGREFQLADEQGQLMSHAIVIDGKSLGFILDDKKIAERFLAVALRCDSVICCRASPIQKANVTELVRCKGKQTCLAIGDGANDVGMIQKANIGIGISGVEGQQAAMSSDFSIAQFRFLERLLLVHGAWCYSRATFMIKYFFYKNFVFGFSIFFFNAYARFSGQSIYADWYLSLYNVLFTAGPVMAIAILDQDLSPQSRLHYPSLYRKGQLNASFRAGQIAVWLINGIIQALACFYVSIISHINFSDGRSGRMIGLFGIGTTMYTCIVFVVNIQIAIAIQYWTWIHHLVIWGELIIWILFLLVSGQLPTKVSGGLRSLFIGIVARAPSYYLVTLLAIVLALLPYFIVLTVSRNFLPSDHDIVQEIEQRHTKSGHTNNKSVSNVELLQYNKGNLAHGLDGKDEPSALSSQRDSFSSQAKPLWSFFNNPEQPWKEHSSRNIAAQRLEAPEIVEIGYNGLQTPHST